MGLGPRKRWGQNFLINPDARRRIVEKLEIHNKETIWEIGPGLGAMTKDLLQEECDLRVFEIDPGYCEYLQMAFAHQGIQIIQGDVLKTWKKTWDIGPIPDKILGNLPYNVASAIIGDLLEHHCIPKRMVFMLQDEMADRMTAKVGTKNYSSFSILCQYHCDIKEGGKLNPGSFYPSPRVSSKIVIMTPRSEGIIAENWSLFFTLVRGLYISRRKTLKNNLLPLANKGFATGDIQAIEGVFNSNGISFSQRAEELAVDQLVSISNGLNKLVQTSDS